MQRAADFLNENYGITPVCTTNYHEVLNKELVDAVYVATSWETHIEISIAAMKAGIPVGCEVGRAYTVEECFDLVKTYEETKTPFMLLENCCFGKEELLATAAVRSGKLGTIVHCSGAYGHDLRGEVSKGNIERRYRLRNYINCNCDNYPTHELGPIARILNITRGNRMVSLVSIASKSCGIKKYIEKNRLYEQDETLKDVEFNQGDIVNTIITCSNGETILLTLDTSLPRFYNRDLKVRGTSGMYEMATNTFFFDGMQGGSWVPAEIYQKFIDNAKEYYDEFMPDRWKNMTDEEKKSGHGGMDGMTFRAFINAVKNGTPMPIDVYDAASWMCVSALSEMSIAQGGAPQSVPDFTNGKWILRKPEDIINYI